jgi:ubiquinone/menaquinone biosynthesis C-methylase UbiE
MRDYEGHRVFNPVYLFYLESEQRAEWQKPDEVLQALALPPGSSVADIGAGGGYFTERFSRWVGDSGHVFATDVQPSLLRKLEKRVAKNSLMNVTVIHAAFEDPTLPERSCDLAFFSSVYKEIDGRVEYMQRLRRALRPGGRVAILEYRPESEARGPERKDRLAESQALQEMEAAGYRLTERFDFLPREYFLVFQAAEPTQ